MPAMRRVLVLALVCVASFAVAQRPSQQPSEAGAARVLGPRWKQISRDSGMIFSGTVLKVQLPRARDLGAILAVEVTVRVDRAIAGVAASQILTIREWAGAWSQHPLSPGEQVLLFLYPQSRLGLTSPVGGALGQLIVKGKLVIPSAAIDNAAQPVSQAPVSITQLERAIRSARSSQVAPPTHGAAAGGKE